MSGFRARDLLEAGSNVRPPEIKQQSSCNRNAYSAAKNITPERVDQISENLSSDDDDCQSPTPKSVAKPAPGGKSKNHAEHQKKDSDGSAEWRKLTICSGIENPHSVEKRATPNQG